MTPDRVETDSFGPISVAASAYWGAQTQRSIANFPFPPHERMPMGVIQGLAHVKRAAALIHKASGALAAPLADAIVEAADAILAGRHDDQFGRPALARNPT
jgi:fumarate hydratase, class II